MLTLIVIVVVVALAVVLGLAATKPDSFTVQRSTSIKASPAKIHPLIADFHAWSGWSPWEKIDPALERSYSGAPSG